MKNIQVTPKSNRLALTYLALAIVAACLNLANFLMSDIYYVYFGVVNTGVLLLWLTVFGFLSIMIIKFGELAHSYRLKTCIDLRHSIYRCAAKCDEAETRKAISSFIKQVSEVRGGERFCSHDLKRIERLVKVSEMKKQIQDYSNALI